MIEHFERQMDITGGIMMKTEFEKIKVDIVNWELEINGRKSKRWSVQDVEEFAISDLRILGVELWVPNNQIYYIIQNRERYENFLKDIAETKSMQPLFASYMDKSFREKSLLKAMFFDACFKYELNTDILSRKIGMPKNWNEDSLHIPTMVYASFGRAIMQEKKEVPRPFPFKNKVFCDKDFDEIKILFRKLMAEDIEELKNEKISQDAINLVNTYKRNYGDDLTKIVGIQDKYLEQKSWSKTCENIDSEINLLKYGIDHNVGAESDIKVIIRALESAKGMVRKQFYAEQAEKLRNEFGCLSEKKAVLLEQLKGIKFDEALQLYRLYISSRDTLIRKDQDSLFSDEESPYRLYAEFYDYGSVLISDYLNKINKDKSKRKNIPQEKIDSVLMYFYEAESAYDAKTARKEAEYNDSRANGARGEKEVDYALKWLDKSYVLIPKLSEDGHGNKCIIISNPEFIDEPQEYDHIVVGRQGLFLIETKNYAGKLIVDKYGNWIRIKQDGTEEGERNPIQQVRRHEKMLRSIISEDIEIIDIICMAHPKMIIEGVENCTIPLIKSDMLVEYIENYDNGKMISDYEIQRCVECIKEYMK